MIAPSADDVIVFITGGEDVKVLSNALKVYEGASSARVNWGKSEASYRGRDLVELITEGFVLCCLILC